MNTLQGGRFEVYLEQALDYQRGRVNWRLLLTNDLCDGGLLAWKVEPGVMHADVYCQEEDSLTH